LSNLIKYIILNPEAIREDQRVDKLTATHYIISDELVGWCSLLQESTGGQTSSECA
jgi:hypothetical protein